MLKTSILSDRSRTADTILFQRKKGEAREVTREVASKPEGGAVQAALEYLDNDMFANTVGQRCTFRVKQ